MMDDDTISSASFNSKMFDQFKDLDSISQLGNGQDLDESGINLGAIKYELQAREKKIRTLHADKLKLRALLKKAKTAIDTINNKHKQEMEQVRLAETKLAHEVQTRNTLQTQLDEFQKRRSGIEKGFVSQILARIKVGEVGYTLIQDVNHGCEWYRDNMIVNIQEQLSKEWKSVQQVNYNIVFVEKQQLEDSLTLCMNQYEERLRRVNEYMENSNSGYLQT